MTDTRLNRFFSTNLPKLTALIACWFCPLQSQAADQPHNELAVADKTPPGIVELTIPTQLPQNLSFKTKAEVMAMRSALINGQSQMLAREYLPSNEIFGAIQDSKPWWGLQGEAFWGAGQRSIEGDSEESRFFLNPYIMIGANGYAFNIWNREKITQADLNDPQFPYNWKPTSIRFWPVQATGEVVYGVSDYNARLDALRDKLKVQRIMPMFALVGYNARDFGYHWLWVDPELSSNIQCVMEPKSATEIRQFIHCGGSCGYPGGCNNMSPGIAELDRMRYTALPAMAYIQLWKNKPSNVQDPPDLTFILRLE